MNRLLLAFMSAAVFAAPSLADTTVIHAGHLITEPGKPVLEKQSIIIEDGKITEVKSGFVDGDAVIDLRSAYVMPGLIDMHSHITLDGNVNVADLVTSIRGAFINRQADQTLSTLPRLKEILHKGFTTIRNLGDVASISYSLSRALDAGIIDGPRMIAVEPQFGVSGGDYDAHTFGVRQELEPNFKSRGTCDGPIDCRRAVRDEIHRGAGVIKLRIAGMALMDPQIDAIEFKDELAAIVETAHKLNRKVATHTPGAPQATQQAIEAGVDTIEHGPLSDENIAAMAKHGTAYTPTMLTVSLAKPMMEAAGLPDQMPVVQSSVLKAYKAGVPILFGSDLPVSPIAKLHEEFRLMQEAGLPADVALASATITAARALGREDSLGSIEAGKSADIIAVQGNPLEDLSVMATVGFVMKSGKTYKSEGF